MLDTTSATLSAFTQRYCQHWYQQYQTAPQNDQLIGFDSPCLLDSTSEKVFWQPQPFTLPKDLDAVSRGIDLVIQESVVAFYTTQFAADMKAKYGELSLTLLQVWNEDDFERVQQNLLGHLVMKRRLKHSPTLFIATTEDDAEIISIDNLTGNVVLEILGKQTHQVLSSTLGEFLDKLTPSE